MSTLTKEIQATQNPALGAVLLWRFVCGYTEAHPTRDRVPIPLLFIVLPMTLHQASFKFIKSTQKASGLRACVAKFSESTESKQDILLSIHNRTDKLRSLTMASLQLALAEHLIYLDMDGTVFPLSTTEPQAGIPTTVASLLRGTEKLGNWCSQLTLHEITSILKVRF